MPPSKPAHFKGNKQSLPSKPCVACGREMTWRKRWARNWEAVKFCSDACRAGRQGSGSCVPAERKAGAPGSAKDAAEPPREP